nr:PREDICTED: synaptonemal complex central element protein 2 [Paralichthys olivaceus]
MDLFFNDMTIPSTSQSTPKKGHEESHLMVETDQDSSFGKFSTARMNNTQEHHMSSSIDNISRRAQELVEKINDGRTGDQKALDSFHEKLVEKVTEACQQMKEHMYRVYEENSNEMQVKLQELSEVLDSCTKLCNELREANQALAGLREGLAIAMKESS